MPGTWTARVKVNGVTVAEVQFTIVAAGGGGGAAADGGIHISPLSISKVAAPYTPHLSFRCGETPRHVAWVDGVIAPKLHLIMAGAKGGLTMNFSKFTKQPELQAAPKFSSEQQKKIWHIIETLFSAYSAGYGITYGAVAKALRNTGLAVFPMKAAQFLRDAGASYESQAAIVNKKGFLGKRAPQEVRVLFAKRFGDKVPDGRLIEDPRVFD